MFWGDLDYLVVDLPPGTADASLTVMQAIPLSGVLLVTSPQGLAGMVVRKAAHMVLQMGAPLLGLIENMSGFTCPHCGEEINIFPVGGAEKLAKKSNLPYLGNIPMQPEIATASDSGEPFIGSNGEQSDAAKRFEHIVNAIIES